MEQGRTKRIFVLALPIIGGMVSQNVLNIVDTLMVARLGTAALAAVGLGGFATFMCQALILGISSGVQATTSRRKGEGKYDRLAVSLNAAILLVLMVAPVLSAILYFIVPELYVYLNDDPQVMAQGIPYLQVRVLAIVFVGVNFSFRGYWNAIDKSIMYMSTLVVMHLSNIGLNYILIFGKFGAPALGVTGAGIASALSTMIGALCYLILGLRYARANGFLRLRPSGEEFGTLTRLSLPSGVQQLFFATGFTALYWIIGLVGTVELAAANVLINITLVAILPGIGLGLAAATLVGQALGRGDPEDAARWGWDVVKVGLVCLGLLGLPMWLFPDPILAGFDLESATLEVARFPLRLVGWTIALEATTLVLSNALLGAGDAKRVMMVSIVSQWLIFLPLAFLIGPYLGMGLREIWLLQVCYRCLQGLVFCYIWKRGAWAAIKL